MITEVVKDLPPSFLERIKQYLIVQACSSNDIQNGCTYAFLLCILPTLIILPPCFAWIATIEIEALEEYKTAKERTDRFIDNVAICKTALRQLQLEKQQVITPGILG